MDDAAIESKRITLVAKWGKERITLEELDDRTTIGEVKNIIAERTGVLQKRQKLIGLTARGGKINDAVVLGDLKVKSGKKREASSNEVVHEFIMMGTKEEQIFVDPGDKDDLPGT